MQTIDGGKKAMARHMVICEQCGRRFDANTGSYYNSASRRYTCKSCAIKIYNQQRAIQRQENAARRKAAADEREKNTGMRQSTGAMIAKIVFGVLFLLVVFGKVMRWVSSSAWPYLLGDWCHI